MPEPLQAALREALRAQGVDLDDARAVAAAIQRLSDFYIANPEAHTPWRLPHAITATLAYYMPLNAARLLAALREPRERGFFTGLERLVDFGCGPGTATLALRAAGLTFRETHLIDRAPEALEWTKRLVPDATSRSSALTDRADAQTLFVASYSLTEAPLPPEALRAEALILLEPSTSEDSRRLMARRPELLRAGYQLWSPCTHREECPLLKHSARDWCHDRVHFERPSWLVAIEEQLPFRNQTLTWFAIFARRRAPPAWPVNSARLVGDLLREKGKDRQLVCRSSEREFLAWMHRDGPSPEWPRGALVEIPTDAVKVSNELRIKKGP